ncbi:MAG: hypothetical protein EPN64_13135 [Burkholderiaceae bacterium]|nr:MAG: hypothetical protein EPN64_13135 [Burkholderiaceae bacterium]
MLDISTAHLSLMTRELLDNEAAGVISYPKGGCGWLVYVPQREDNDESRGIGEDCPCDLGECLRYAQDQGAHWIMFDCDAESVLTLRVYNDDTELV